MKIIDGDKLLKEIKEMDLEYMQQVDIIDCLEDLINKQPGISKEININKVTNFDNRKVNKQRTIQKQCEIDKRIKQQRMSSYCSIVLSVHSHIKININKKGIKDEF